MIVPIVSYVVCLLVSIWGIQFHISLFKYPIYLLAPITLAVFIPLSIINLLPIDYVQHNSNLSTYIPDNILLILWKLTYWITFLLTWLILPILQEFYKSGHFNKLHKLVDALKKNLRFQLIILSISILTVIYLILEIGLSFNHLKLMIIGISHIYGLVIALWLMAHGLINIPRNKWIFGNLISHLNFRYLSVPKLIDNLEDCKISFKEDILKVLILYKDVNEMNITFRDWILELYHRIPQDLKESVELQIQNNLHDLNLSVNDVNNEFMTDLNSSFDNNLYKLIAYESEFQSLFRKIILLEDLLNCNINNLNFRLDDVSKFKFVLLTYISPIFNRFLSLVVFILSFIIIESEFFHSTKLSLINLIFNKFNNFGKVGLTVIIFSFMLICSLNSLTQLKIFNKYHLVPHKSDPVSCCFYSSYIARLTIPLSYNFITLFISRSSIFENWFGRSVHLTGLFNLLNNWIPRLLLIPILLTTFNVYDKLKLKLGLNNDFYDSLGFDDNDDNKRKDLIIVEAKRIINREINRRLNTQPIRSFNLSYGNLVEETTPETPNEYPNENQLSLWSSVSNQFNNLKNQFTRDNSLHNFDYDQDANSNLIL